MIDYSLDLLALTGHPWLSVAYIAASHRQHNNFWFRVPSGQMAIFFFSGILLTLK
jgi:hypothetical protein